LSIIYEDEKTLLHNDAAFSIFMAHIFENPSTMNYKIIQCDIPSIMVSTEKPHRSLKDMFLTPKEKEDG